jgi:bacterioferritin
MVDNFELDLAPVRMARETQLDSQLGGAPNFNPEGLLMRSHSEYVEGQTLLDMIKEDLVAERVAIDSYREMIEYFKGFDTTTRKMLEEIQAAEEQHADDLAELLDNLPKQPSA